MCRKCARNSIKPVEMPTKMSPTLCAEKVQEIVPYTISENVKEILKFPVVGNMYA